MGNFLIRSWTSLVVSEVKSERKDLAESSEKSSEVVGGTCGGREERTCLYLCLFYLCIPNATYVTIWQRLPMSHLSLYPKCYLCLVLQLVYAKCYLCLFNHCMQHVTYVTASYMLLVLLSQTKKGRYNYVDFSKHELKMYLSTPV